MQRRTGIKRPAVKSALIAAAVLSAAAIGVRAFAEPGDDGGDVPPPGEVITGTAQLDDGTSARITTGSTTYDATLLTKFIPGTGFDPMQGAGVYADVVSNPSTTPTCVSADAASGGVATELRAAVELPDGARIRRIFFYGQDSDGGSDIAVRLSKTTIRVPTIVGSPSRIDTSVTSFTTSGAPGVTVVGSADNLNEVVGSLAAPGGVVAGVDHQFHQIHVTLNRLSATNHKLCGVEVQYQVPTVSDVGTVFHPLAGYRAYDSRLEMAPVADGPLGAGPGRVIPVKDGRNVVTGVINAPNAIPSDATAVAYTVTAADPTGSGFLFVGPGNAVAITASSLNWDINTSGAIANSGIVKLGDSRDVKVFADGSAGASTDFIIDITGYYAAPANPNMGN